MNTLRQYLRDRARNFVKLSVFGVVIVLMLATVLIGNVGVLNAASQTALHSTPSAKDQSATATDQPDHHACRYAPAFNVASLPPPPLMEGIGNSELKVTTNSELAQKYFNQGIRLLHCFWDVEAYRAFREATRRDENCAMAYWGIFTALSQNRQEMGEERTAALEKALALSDRASEQERFYIRAASLLADPGKGRASYISEMEALIDRYPDDVEAKLFLANTLSTPVSTYAPNGRPREGKLYGQAILRNLLITHPDHAAVHHYWIHAVENGPRPEEALASAAKLPILAPGSGHMLHMPGHIYYRLGQYEKARNAFIASMEADETYMKARKMHPINNWNYVHNLDYLVATCAEDGRYEEGLRWARLLEEVPSDENRLKASGLGYILYGGHTSASRFQMRYGHWDDAADSIADALAKKGVPGSLAPAYYRGVLAYAKGMGAIARDDLSEADEQGKALDELLKQLGTERSQLGSDWYFSIAMKILAVNSLELRGSIASLRGEHEEAIKMLRDAAEREKGLGYWEPPHYTRPIWESLGQAYLRAKRWEEAAEAFRLALKVRPQSGHGLFGLANAYALSGKKEDARKAYDEFLSSWRGADSGLQHIQEANRWLTDNGVGK